jgi:hypothetical protein
MKIEEDTHEPRRGIEIEAKERDRNRSQETERCVRHRVLEYLY